MKRAVINVPANVLSPDQFLKEFPQIPVPPLFHVRLLTHCLSKHSIVSHLKSVTASVV